LNSKRHDHELNADNDMDLIKNQILQLCLVQSGPKICLAIIEGVGFLFINEKVVKSTVTMDDLRDTNKQIKFVGQIVDLKMSSSTMQFWDWNKQYVAMDIDSCDRRLTFCQYVMGVASSLICPHTLSVVQRPLPQSKLDIDDYLTW
jgi:hypothetical protein